MYFYQMSEGVLSFVLFDATIKKDIYVHILQIQLKSAAVCLNQLDSDPNTLKMGFAMISNIKEIKSHMPLVTGKFMGHALQFIYHIKSTKFTEKRIG